MRANVMKVWLNRAEGPCELCGEVVIEGYNVMADVVAKLVEWGETAPEQGDGYDKVDFRVEWENGMTHSGRFDLNKGGTDGGMGFWESLMRRVKYAACQFRPAHFNDNHWAHHCSEYDEKGWKTEAEKMLAECEIVDTSYIHVSRAV